MVGRSNVGKSTLLNALVGSKIAITSPKAQTTRVPIHGIVSREEGQIVFVDTPGVFTHMHDSLSKRLTHSVSESLQDIDMVLYVVDPTREIGDEEKAVLRLLDHVTCPKILVVNKIDIYRKPFYDFFMDLKDKFTDVIEISAKQGTHIQSLIEMIYTYLPESEELFYPEGQLTNISNERWLAELIREKLFLRLRQEVPYSVHVEVETVEEREKVLYIKATIYTTDDRYQGMIIGKGGRGIREIGQSTRKELEAVMDRQIYLDLNVEVNPHWAEQYL
ncbi:MAG: GTPase Era [Candidatus Uhrbacteria bacterium GW2011_GWE2_46_68]|uniref:GTPase Era n=2 Tax=Candidatus Uhriibacteriota TaxID=1752732 RepID=A0A0G1SG34_9BACT|nr:MAG: GTPase Era [Candidatus Uhrbacteria bacterium GW2011_GWF2_46_218]KKU41033.1 MAG: GTPase Era [Candidatus Uhrbacteria bacterium GW2011_GWE2_46_68]